MLEIIKLLFIEDDPDFSQIVKDSLELTGNYEVCAAKNGVEGYNAYKTFQPDIIVSDVEMPEMSGLEMVKLIREEDLLVPILFASAKITPRDIAEGFKLDIDNYIKKPYLPAELDLHIRAILRRITKPEKSENKDSNIYSIGRYLFDLKKRCLTLDNEQFSLTYREVQILEMLYKQKGNIVKRADLLLQFWGTDNFYTSRSLDVFISKLRKYLEKDPFVKIVTIRGEGLQLLTDDV